MIGLFCGWLIILEVSLKGSIWLLSSGLYLQKIGIKQPKSLSRKYFAPSEFTTECVKGVVKIMNLNSNPFLTAYMFNTLKALKHQFVWESISEFNSGAKNLVLSKVKEPYNYDVTLCTKYRIKCFYFGIQCDWVDVDAPGGHYKCDHTLKWMQVIQKIYSNWYLNNITFIIICYSSVLNYLHSAVLFFNILTLTSGENGPNFRNKNNFGTK